jgi:hypothetical protein
MGGRFASGAERIPSGGEKPQIGLFTSNESAVYPQTKGQDPVAREHEIQALVYIWQTRPSPGRREDGGRRCRQLGAQTTDPGLERVERRRQGCDLVKGRRPVWRLVDLLHVLLEEG